MVGEADKEKEIEIIVPSDQECISEVDRVQLEIERLRRRCIVELKHVQNFYGWLDRPRVANVSVYVVQLVV